MGVDHGGRGTSPPEFGVGDAKANCPPPILSHRYKMERSVAFEICQNPFSAVALPRTPLGELMTLTRHPSRLGRGHPSHTSPHSTPTHLRRLPCVPLNSSQIYAYTLVSCGHVQLCRWTCTYNKPHCPLCRPALCECSCCVRSCWLLLWCLWCARR